MKVYLATSGEYSDYRVQHVFARREDAEAYMGADSVEEREVLAGPVEMHPWHRLIWAPGFGDRKGSPSHLANPHEYSYLADYDNDPQKVTHRWWGPPQRTGPVLEVEGWDLQRIRKVYSEQRAQYLARSTATCENRKD